MSKQKRIRDKIILSLFICIMTFPPLSGFSLFAQKEFSKEREELKILKSLTGKVVDAEGRPLEGASVWLRGQQERTVTNKDGEFFFPSVLPDQQVEFYYIGYEPVVQNVSLSGVLLIRLAEDKRILEEPTGVALCQPLEKKEEVFSEKPLPLGGEEEYRRYLEEKLIRPADTECRNQTGTVIVLFSIDEKGRPYNIRIRKGLCLSCDQEAIRLINAGPRWSHAGDDIEVSILF